MWKPEVGQKYLCVCEHRTATREGDVLKVVKNHKDFNTVKLQNISTGYEINWAYEKFPDDFKLVQGDIPKINIPMFAEEDDLKVFASMIKNFSNPVQELTPRDAHDSLRVQHILAAMQRYVAANKPVPEAWMEELIEKVVIDYEQ